MKPWLMLIILGAGPCAATELARVDALKAEYHAHVTRLRAEFASKPAAPADKEWIKAKLQHMVELDQYMRSLDQQVAVHTFSPEERQAWAEFSFERYKDVDGRNLADLKKLLASHRWFTISEFGATADHNAWLLVQHADEDRGFQQQILAVLEPLSRIGETSPKNFAYLYDRVAVNLRDPAKRSMQRYGTQGRCTGPGTWEPFPVEAPEQLDERRRSVGLTPQAEYQALFKGLCVESQEATVRKVIEAAKPGN